jgi:hypothetical protein
MATVTAYHPGGFIATAAQQNRAELWDPASGYTSWDLSGKVLASRPLSAAESAALAAQDAANSAAQSVSTAQSGLNTLHGSLPGWQSQLQADLTTVAAGWDTLTPAQRSDIITRMLNGFASAMSATVDHATVTGALPPA